MAARPALAGAVGGIVPKSVNERLNYLQSTDFAMKFNSVEKRPRMSPARIYGTALPL
jgi:hypothetical protein